MPTGGAREGPGRVSQRCPPPCPYPKLPFPPVGVGAAGGACAAGVCVPWALPPGLRAHRQCPERPTWVRVFRGMPCPPLALRGAVGVVVSVGSLPPGLRAHRRCPGKDPPAYLIGVPQRSSPLPRPARPLWASVVWWLGCGVRRAAANGPPCPAAVPGRDSTLSPSAAPCPSPIALSGVAGCAAWVSVGAAPGPRARWCGARRGSTGSFSGRPPPSPSVAFVGCGVRRVPPTGLRAHRRRPGKPGN